MRLHIFGASGTGVTTLGQALGSALNVPYFDSDDYFWQPSNPPFTIRRPPAERDAALAADLAQAPRWILGGSILGWDPQWATAFDLVVFIILDIREIVYRQWFYSPIGGKNVRWPSVDKRAPFVLHVQRPSEAFPESTFPRGDFPV